jgi:DNA-binding NtrC family response regulator
LNILIIDDEKKIRKSLSSFLDKLGHTVFTAENGKEGLHKFHSVEFDLVITDILMPEMNGLEVLRRIKKVMRSTAGVIVVTGHGDMENAIRALKYGAYDYLLKPIDVRELAIILKRFAEYIDLRNRYLGLKEEFQERLTLEMNGLREEAERIREAYLHEVGLDKIQVYSDSMRDVVDLAEKYSVDRSIPVLIHGESGTGKELIARYIHFYNSGQKALPFVAINCGAVTQDVIEGELFGHEPGAYTGATTEGRMGKIEAANGGTLFLDEISEMPLTIQVKLLRVLEEKKLYRLGGTKEISIDVRVISSTNRDLKKEVAMKRFRLDLLYRINVGVLSIPPLRERREDILPMAYHFISNALTRRGKKVVGFTSAAERFLVSYEWPGNARQLKNAMERIALLINWEMVDVEDIQFVEESPSPNDLPPKGKPILTKDDFDLPAKGLDLEDINREIISKALEINRGNQLRTSRYLGISRRILQGKMKKLGLDRKNFSP